MSKYIYSCIVERSLSFRCIAYTCCALLVYIFMSDIWFYRTGTETKYQYTNDRSSTGNKSSLENVLISTRNKSSMRGKVIINKTQIGPAAKCLGKISLAVRGKMGNQMCQYAALMAIALRNRLSPVMQPGKMVEIMQTFQMPNKPTSANRGEIGRYRSLPVICKVACRYDNRTEDLHAQLNTTCASELNVLLVGYFQGTGRSIVASDHYFYQIESFIRKEFTPQPSFLKNAETFLDTVKSAVSDVVIGIHIRRGEWAPRGLAVHLSYYLLAIDFCVDKYGSNVSFVIASNGMEWAQENIKPTKDVKIFFSPFGDYSNDFALLYSCNHMITSFGTYSWWAGYLTRGIKIIPYEPDRNSTDWIYLPPSLANRTTWTNVSGY